LPAACTDPSFPTSQNQGQAEDDKAAVAGSGPFPSCYAEAAFDEPAPAIEREVFVIIDRTTALSPALVESLTQRVAEYVGRPGTKVTLGTFSATTSQAYAGLGFSASAETPWHSDQRDSVNANKLRALDMCLGDQPAKLAARAANEIRAAAPVDSGSFANSEIMGSLASLSEAVRTSPAKEKLVVLASDLLEHSSTTSFYESKAIRQIDAAVELGKAERARLFGDFGGAKIAIMGAGLLPPEADPNQTRPADRMLGLEDFWRGWFEKSNGTVVAFGKPQLMTPLL
jgi:hypothetical protein